MQKKGQNTPKVAKKGTNWQKMGRKELKTE